MAETTQSDIMAGVEDALRSTALFGLRQMSGLEFGPEPSRWRLWLRSEMIWFQTESSETLERIQRNEVPVVLSALDDLRAHRYRRFEVARQVEPLLSHRAEGVRARACAAHQDLAPEISHEPHEGCSLVVSEFGEALAGGDVPPTGSGSSAN